MPAKKKYFTDEERSAARRARDKGYKAKKYWAQQLIMAGPDGRVKLQEEACEPRPPPELIMERDFRFELISLMSSGEQISSIPPNAYSSAYYAKAWKFQRDFARG